jgi:hypothetical protein
VAALAEFDQQTLAEAVVADVKKRIRMAFVLYYLPVLFVLFAG